jgi:hypothetical protein
MDFCKNTKVNLDLIASDYHMFGLKKIKSCVDEYLPVMMKLRAPCTRGFGHNRHLSSQIRSEGLRTDTKYVLKKRDGYVAE